MKKTILLTLALGLAGISSMQAGNIDVFVTGSTAFRANVYLASQKLFVGGNPNVFYGSAANGGADSGFSKKTASWAMTGTPIPQLTNIQGNTLTVHGLFTGSVQGIQTVEEKTPLHFANADGANNGLCATYVDAAPTIGFSDASGSVTPYPASGNYVEEDVAVQPFVLCKSAAPSGAVASINNVTWEQFAYGIPKGRIPLSAWTTSIADTNTYVYLLQRTLDSGTRRCETAQQYYQYGDTVGIYIYDQAAHGFYGSDIMVLSNNATGLAPYGVVGSAGLNNANVDAKWGFGYVAGSGIAAALGITEVQNQSIGYLSFADAQNILAGNANNWSQVLAFNGLWPTAQGSSIKGNTGTNDFSPITLGYYPCWGALVLVHPVNPTGTPGNNITQFQLGNNSSPGSFMGVFNAQTAINGGAPLVGSIENEIELSKTLSPGATAIRLSDMKVKRAQVGGVISLK